MNDPYILLRIVLASRSRALHRVLLSSRAYAAVARVHRTQLVHALTTARPYPLTDGLQWRHCDTGKLHRDDGPAIEWANGTTEYYKNGALHRDDGPAVEHADGTKKHYKNGAVHREDGPAIERADGTKWYCINGTLHRDDGPAIEWANGTLEYWCNDKLHRDDGPAIERADGSVVYWLDGEKVTREEFEKRRKNKKQKRI